MVNDITEEDHKHISNELRLINTKLLSSLKQYKTKTLRFGSEEYHAYNLINKLISVLDDIYYKDYKDLEKDLYYGGI